MARKNNHDTEDMMPPAEAAKILGVTERTLQFWRSFDRGPIYHKLSYRIVRYKYEDLLSFRKEQSHLSR